MNVKKVFSCRTTIKLFIIYAIQSICGGVAFYISLFLKSNTQLNALQIGTVISAISCGNVIGSYFAGYIADKYNPSYALKYGLITQGLALFNLIFIKHIVFIFLTMMFMGFGSYLYITASNFILNSKYNVSTIGRAKIISFQSITSNIGMFSAAILMGYSSEGYYYPIFLSIALVIILIGLILRPVNKTFYLPITDHEADVSNQKLNSNLYKFGLMGIAIIGLIYSQQRLGYPMFLEENFGNINTGYLLSLNPLIIIFFQTLIIKFISRLNELLILSLGLLLFGLSFLILNSPMSISMAVFSCIIITIGEILGITYAQSITFGHAPEQIRGRILGLYKSIYSLTKIIGSYFAGIIIKYLSYKWLWLFCFGLGTSGFVFIVFFIIFNKNTNYDGNKLSSSLS